MFVRVKWFYHPEETKGGNRLVEIKVVFHFRVQSIDSTQSTGEKDLICLRLMQKTDATAMFPGILSSVEAATAAGLCRVLFGSIVP